MRPIDGDELIERFQSRFYAHNLKCDFDRCARSVILSCMEAVQRSPTICEPPNDPLTLEELREMDGEYVYAVLPSGFGNRWAFVQVLSEGRNGIHLMYHDGASSAGFLLDCGAKFYRRKPEGNA